MKQLDLSFTGGHPFKIDDLAHLQDGIKEVFKLFGDGLGFGTAAYIITGIDLTIIGPNVNVTAGSLYFNGEVYPVDAHTFTIAIPPGETLYWIEQIDVLPPSPTTYQNLSVNDVHIRKHMKLQYSLLPPVVPYILPSATQTRMITNIIHSSNIIKEIKRESTPPALLGIGIPTVLTSFIPSVTKKSNKMLYTVSGFSLTTGFSAAFNLEILHGATTITVIPITTEALGAVINLNFSEISAYLANETVTLRATRTSGVGTVGFSNVSIICTSEDAV